MDNLDRLRKIVADKQAGKLKFGTSKRMIDLTTASCIVSVYDTVNETTQGKMLPKINGDFADFMFVANICMR